MTILLFGVSNVGKSITGEILASRLNYEFYDLDLEVKKYLNVTLEEFVNTGTLWERDQLRCKLINTLVKKGHDMILAVTPLSYIHDIEHLFSSESIFAVELVDSPHNIFDRLVFSDENDNIYKDDEYKNRHRQHYLHEISADLEWYGKVYSVIENKFEVNGMPAELVADSLIDKFHFVRKEV
jgi:shikimate kinase